MKKEKKIVPVDVTNDSEMVSLGIRPRNYVGRNKFIWTKTNREKNKLKKAKASFPDFDSPHWGGNSHRPLYYADLYVNLGSQTLHFWCGNTEISKVLVNYDKREITGVHFNGKRIA